jgi:aromatic-amino-acid transaminase
VATIFANSELSALWRSELDGMRERMLAMRRALFERIEPGLEVGYLLRQRGMFSYTGLSAEAVDRIREKHGVYLIRSGRMCVAGLNSSNLDAVARALSDH